MAINWKWGAEEKKKGDEGFNNAGILTFNSHAINSFVRELFQNSNDARLPGKSKVVINIEYCTIRKSDIPAFDQFKKVLDQVQKSHPYQVKFFKKAYESIKGDKIPFLVYSDYNTKGLEGKDTENGSSFVACVLSEGVSAKEDKSAGGSFGIGKNAIYGISNLRTVFYSSYNRDGEHIFQGVAKLASYKTGSRNHEGRIYLGNGEERSSIRKQKDIPEVFRRDASGLSQYVMGVELEDNWHTEFSKAVLRNYWMLLHEGRLEVELFKNGTSIQRINARNVESMMEELFSQEEEQDETLTPYGNPYWFYQAVKNGKQTSFDIPIIGPCTFYYIEHEQGENNVAYLRNGMVIFSKTELRLVGVNITGVFLCDNKKGNQVLRMMEPPKHDSFEEQMLENNDDELTKKDGVLILKNIKNSIRGVIKELIDKYKQPTETPAFLTELFDDLQKAFADSNKGSRNNTPSEPETIHRRAIQDEININLRSEQENSFVSSSRGNIPGTGGGEAPRDREVIAKNGKSSKKAGSSRGGKTPRIAVKSRVFHFGESSGRNVYKAVLSTAEPVDNAELNLYQYSDSGDEIAFVLHEVTDAQGKKIKFREITDADGTIKEYAIATPISGKQTLYLEVSDNQRSAFIIK
ncbi:MAG: hypothetical protein DI539_13285 [Flavobacterium psychrophilum]|nr:MAG: hypothetical protein DI539_13285 [Flavobacterium psychrophilum]